LASHFDALYLLVIPLLWIRLVGLLRMLGLLPVDHRGDFLGLLVESLFLAELGFLVLLGEIAGRAAASAEAVLASVSGEVVLGAHISTGDHGEDEADTETAETTEGHALESVSWGVSRLWFWKLRTEPLQAE
jgi:hypothetical protein